MNENLILSLTLLGVCVFFFVINKPRMDVVSLLALMLLPLLGVIDMKEALSGFSDPSVILIALMFVVGEGLIRTGISTDVGLWILKKSRNNPTKLIVFLMVAVAVIGSVMSSTGIVALFIPIVLGICRSQKISPAKLMMPLSFAGLISGMMSLVATPPNMVVNSVLTRENYPSLGFFAFTPIGVLVLAAGVGYMLYVRKFLGGNDDAEAQARSRGKREMNLVELAERYRVTWRDAVFVVTADSPLCGRKIRECPLRSEYAANIVCIDRREQRLGKRSLINPVGETELREGDALLIDFLNETTPAAIAAGAEKLRLRQEPLEGGRRFAKAEREFGLLEISVMPDSDLEGKTLAEARFREKYRMSVYALRRNNAAVSGERLARERFKVGDTLLVGGPWKELSSLQTWNKHFIVLALPEEYSRAVAVPGGAPFALASVAVMVGLMIFTDVPSVLAALIACMILIFSKCVDIDRAYRCVNWSSIILIVGMIPFATALEKTGGVAHAASAVMATFGDSSPRVILGAMMATTMIVGLFMSNTVTAVLLAPLAVSVAESLELSPYPFAVGIAIAASTAFMTPISSPVNTLVLEPGRYKFFDFVKVGVPFSIIVLLIGVVFIPLFFPFES